MSALCEACVWCESRLRTLELCPNGQIEMGSNFAARRNGFFSYELPIHREPDLLHFFGDPFHGRISIIVMFLLFNSHIWSLELGAQGADEGSGSVR
jgi:hypothetical protein